MFSVAVRLSLPRIFWDKFSDDQFQLKCEIIWTGGLPTHVDYPTYLVSPTSL